MRLEKLALAGALWLAPGVAQAHVRWFVDESLCGTCHFTLDRTSALVVLGALLYAAAAVAAHRAWPERAALEVDRAGWRLVAGLTGLMLVADTALGTFLAPPLRLPGPVLLGLGLTAQLSLGLALLGQRTLSVCGLVLLGVSAALPLVVPLPLLADYAFEFSGLGLALFFAGPALCPLDRALYRRLGLAPARVAHLPLPTVRVALGLTLCALALDEKLLHPHLAVAFLRQHPLNFMPALGFAGFTDLHFTLAAGVAELTLGALLAAGVAARPVAATLAVFFGLTPVLLGPLELVGHAPLLGVLVLLLRQGAGRLALAPAPGGPGSILGSRPASD